MITEWFQNLGVGLVAWLVSLMPVMNDADGVVVTASNALTTVIVATASLGVWIPWGVIATCVGLALSAYFVTIFFKFARVIVAHIPLVGGAG